MTRSVWRALLIWLAAMAVGLGLLWNTRFSADVSFCGAFGVSMRNSRRFVCSLPTLRPTSAISSITYRATNAMNDSCSTPSAAALPEA